MKVELIYITVGNKEEATTLGKELVTSGLAACVNIIDNVHSMYMWEGELQDDKETILIAKTTQGHVPELIEKVKALHSYDCPCILSLPVSGGNRAFLDWVADEVK